MFEEADDPIDFLKRFACCRSHDRKIVSRNLFERRLVRHVTAGNLHEMETMLDDLVNRDFVPWSAHRKKTGFHNGFFDPPILIPGQTCLRKALDVFQVVTTLIRGMYAGGNIAILQFHAKGERKSFRSSLEFPDDADAMFHIPHMVVGHFIDEEWPTIEVPHSPIYPVRT